MLKDYQLRMYEDLSAYKSKIRIIKTKQITNSAFNIIISVPNFEPNSFKSRSFELCFEVPLPEGQEEPLEMPIDRIKAVIRLHG